MEIHRKTIGRWFYLSLFSSQPLAKIAGKDGKTWVVARFDHAGVTKMVESEQQDPHGE